MTPREYLEAVRWPEGVRCARCGRGERITIRKDGYYRCNACRFDFTVRTGTVLARSHVPLEKWLQAIELLAARHRTSAELARELGITLKSAWLVRRRLERACGENPVNLASVLSFKNPRKLRGRGKKNEVKNACINRR